MGYSSEPTVFIADFVYHDNLPLDDKMSPTSTREGQDALKRIQQGIGQAYMDLHPEKVEVIRMNSEDENYAHYRLKVYGERKSS